MEKLCRVLQFETVQGNSDAFKKQQDYLFQAFPNVFTHLEIKRFGDFALLLKWQGQDEALKPWMCIAHQDVVGVPPAEVADWTYPPFSGTVSDGFIWGRGALDMKSTLVALLEAINRLLEEGFIPKRTLYIYSGDDEEIAGPTAKIAAKWMEEEHIHLSTILDEGGAIAEEFVPGIKMPVALIGTSQKGVMNIKLSVKGSSGHAAQPPLATPIDILGAACAKVMQNPMPIHPDSPVFPLLHKLAPSMPFFKRFLVRYCTPLLKAKLAKVPIMNAMMRTTCAPTLFESGITKNVLPDIASANINIRLYPGDTKETVMKHVEEVISDSRVILELLDAEEAIPFSHMEDNPISKVIGRDLIVSPCITIGGTDGRHFRKLCDNLYQFLNIRATIEEFKRIHGKDERISIDNNLNQITFYYELIKNE